MLCTSMHALLCCSETVSQGDSLLCRHFFLINNGMRGPFTLASAASQHWTAPFTSRLAQEVHLVGTYVSCEVKTHVQGPFLAADRSGHPSTTSNIFRGQLHESRTVCFRFGIMCTLP